jgi:threonine/homoserine/homoserine lactone efflux protein
MYGTVGTLATFTMLSPVSNPQYVLWWLPVLIVVVGTTDRGYWQVGMITLAAITFSIGILGPAALIAPLATYTHVVSDQLVASYVTNWYLAPGRLWGATLGDDFLGPAVLAFIFALTSLYVTWLRTPKRLRRRLVNVKERGRL